MGIRNAHVGLGVQPSGARERAGSQLELIVSLISNSLTGHCHPDELMLCSGKEVLIL